MTGPGQFEARVTVGPLWAELLAGMTRNAFCRACGVERESLNRWARGQCEPRAGSIALIAQATGRPIVDVRALLLAIVAEARVRHAQPTEGQP